MNTALRILARVALVACAILFVFPHIGVHVSGGLGRVLALSAGFEVVCWIIGSLLAAVITGLGFKKENAWPLAAVAFTGAWFALLLVLSSVASSLLTVTSWQAALFGTGVLLIISGITTWRGKKPAA
jgi:hypothetical protein